MHSVSKNNAKKCMQNTYRKFCFSNLLLVDKYIFFKTVIIINNILKLELF